MGAVETLVSYPTLLIAMEGGCRNPGTTLGKPGKTNWKILGKTVSFSRPNQWPKAVAKEGGP